MGTKWWFSYQQLLWSNSIIKTYQNILQDISEIPNTSKHYSPSWKQSNSPVKQNGSRYRPASSTNMANIVYFFPLVCLFTRGCIPLCTHYIPLYPIIPSTCLPVLLNSSKFYWLHTWCSLIKCSPSPQSLSSLNRWKPPVFREFSSHGWFPEA